MASEQLVRPNTPRPVRVWIPDETETSKVPVNEDHNEAMRVTKTDLSFHARRKGLRWLVRADTQLEYPRADGTTGSLYPDVMMARDVSVDPTGPFSIESLGRGPDLVIEILSSSTASNDWVEKMEGYAQMGIGEYVLFDARKRARPLIAGFRLAEDGRYEPITGAWGGGIWLESIDLRMVPEPADEARGVGPLIRLYAGDEMLPHADEEALRTLELERTLLVEQRTRWQAEQAQASERERAERAERGRRQAERDRAQAEQAHVAERERAEQAERAQASERERAERAEAELAQLRALLEHQDEERS